MCFFNYIIFHLSYVFIHCMKCCYQKLIIRFHLHFLISHSVANLCASDPRQTYSKVDIQVVGLRLDERSVDERFTRIVTLPAASADVRVAVICLIQWLSCEVVGVLIHRDYPVKIISFTSGSLKWRSLVFDGRDYKGTVKVGDESCILILLIIKFGTFHRHTTVIRQLISED